MVWLAVLVALPEVARLGRSVETAIWLIVFLLATAQDAPGDRKCQVNVKLIDSKSGLPYREASFDVYVRTRVNGLFKVSRLIHLRSNRDGIAQLVLGGGDGKSEEISVMNLDGQCSPSDGFMSLTCWIPASHYPCNVYTEVPFYLLFARALANLWCSASDGTFGIEFE